MFDLTPERVEYSEEMRKRIAEAKVDLVIEERKKVGLPIPSRHDN